MRPKTLLYLLALSSASLAFDGARYLVICRDEFVSVVAPLTEWRHATGLSSKVVRLSEIGTDTTAVRNYIVNAYNTWPVKPAYVLLVADPAFLRAKIYGSGPTRYYSDNYYGDMTGDFRAELVVGRFPAKTVDQCQHLVNKTLAYENRPDTTAPWMQKLTTVVREDGDPDDSIYWNNVRHAAALTASAGFAGCDSLSYFRGHAAWNVLNSVNLGTGLLMYRGRGSGNWYSPFSVDPGLCANGERLPVVLSITCETMALDPYDSMVGQAWMFAGSPAHIEGAVAFFGNTHSAVGVAARRSPVARGFFTGLFAENRVRLGDAALRAKAQLYQEYPDTLCREDYRGFTIFGDPALSVWTAAPKRLAVSHPGEILRGTQPVTVSVRSAGNPVAGALVCASMDSTVYVSGNTNSEGLVTLTVSPRDTGRIRLVVTGPNLYPYDGEIRVVTQVGVCEPPKPSRAAVLACRPNPFRGSVFLRMAYGVERSAWIRIRDLSGRVVRSLPAYGAERQASGVIWDGSDDSGRPVRAGMYFVELADASGRVLARTRLTRLR